MEKYPAKTALHLFSTKAQVHLYNDRCMEEVAGEPVYFQGKVCHSARYCHEFWIDIYTYKPSSSSYELWKRDPSEVILSKSP